MIYFVRHGHKLQGDHYNEALGICDDPLNEEGLKDAERIAAVFRDIAITKIYASQYVRTQQTAAPTAQRKGLPVIVDPRVNEMNGGIFHRMGDEKARAAYSDIWQEILEHTHDVRYPGGECGAEATERQDSFLAEMEKEQGDILVFSHDGFIRLLMCNILGLPVWMRYKFKTTMGGISTVEYDGAEWRILRFNQII